MKKLTIKNYTSKIIFGGILILTMSCNKKTLAVFSSKENFEIKEPNFDYLTAKAKFYFKHQDKSIDAVANIRLKKDSLIWISITPGLGIEAARVLIDHQRVKLLDRFNKHYYEYSFAQLREKIDIEINFQVIQSVILGTLSNRYKKKKITKLENYYTYDDRLGAYSIKNYIGSNSGKLEKMKVVNSRTENTMSVNYSDFIQVMGQIFPSSIVSIIKYGKPIQPNMEVKISYTKLTIEPTPIQFPYVVSDGYKKK